MHLENYSVYSFNIRCLWLDSENGGTARHRMGVDGLSLWLPELLFPESVVTSAQKNSVVKDKICVYEAE